MYLAAPVHIYTCKYTPTHIYVNYHIGTYTMTPASSRGTCIFKRQKHTGKNVQTHIYFLKEARVEAEELSCQGQHKFKSVISGDWVIHPSAKIGLFCFTKAIFTVNSPFFFTNSLVPSKGSIINR